MREWIAIGALALGGCQTVARGEIYEEMIQERLKQLGHDAEVDCPDSIPLGRVQDNRFECVLIERGGRTEVVVQLGHAYNEWKLRAK